MLYKEFLKMLTTCPFCGTPKNRIMAEAPNAYLTYSIAPYHKHHLMVIPKRHVEDFKELSDSETKSIEKLLHSGVNILCKLNYEDYTILLRNGKSNGKSIAHLHYHIIPTTIIGDVDQSGEERQVMSEAEIDQLMTDTKLLN